MTVSKPGPKEDPVFDINGKVAVVTGGTSGIGLATAKAFLEKDAKVVIAGRNARRGEQALAELKKVSDDVVYRQCDTSDEQEVKDLIDYAVATYGELDIMYNNAGIANWGPVDQMSGEDFRKLISINLTGVYYGIHYAAIQMKKQGHGGAIVSTSSIEGTISNPNPPFYNAAKGGVNLLTQSSALAQAKDGIRVNTVNPGYVDTGMINPEA